MNEAMQERVRAAIRQPMTWIGLLAIGFLFVYLSSFSAKEGKGLIRLARDEVVVLRTPGGMLEVSTLIKNEEFAWRTTFNCPLISCKNLIKPTVSEIRVPVHYTYRVPLAETWTLTPKGSYWELTVPEEEPKLPAAIDFTKMETRTDKGWFSPNARENRETLLRQLGPELGRRAGQHHYLQAQREDARKTVSEFAQKWVSEQGDGKRLQGRQIKVLFKGEATPTAP